MTTERWLPVPGYEALYEVSDRGRVRSSSDRKGSRSGQLRRLKRDKTGRLRVDLWRDSKGVTRLVHHLVLEAFVGPRPDGLECLHDNGDPSDNRLENLSWGTSSKNKLDTVRHGNHHYAQRDRCGNGHRLVETRPNSSKRICRACAAGKEAVRRGSALSVKDYADEFLRRRGLHDWIL